METWKDVVDYEGQYMVSDKGRVKSLSDRFGRVRILKTHTDSKGNYVNVVLTKNKKRKTFLVHRLAAQSFIENPENKPEVNHKDGNGLNNKSSNLEWVTKAENSKHAVLNDARGQKLCLDDVIEIKCLLDRNWFYHREIAEAYGVSQTTITEINIGSTWRHV